MGEIQFNYLMRRNIYSMHTPMLCRRGLIIVREHSVCEVFVPKQSDRAVFAYTSNKMQLLQCLILHSSVSQTTTGSRAVVQCVSSGPCGMHNN